MSADPIPAVREEDAQGEVAAIFADLRATLGVPFVNLIWRHLATIPNALPWTWQVVKPLYGSADLARAASGLRSEATVPGLDALPDFVWDCGGVPPSDRAAIGRLIDDYNVANGVNFLAMLVAVGALEGDVTPEGEPVSRIVPMPTSTGPAPPRLLGLSELAPPLRRLVEALDQLGRLGPNDAIASLYRHLGHWPAFLALAHTALQPHHLSGALAAAQERVIARGRTEAAGLAALAAAPSIALDPEARARALASTDAFTRLMIGRMVVLGGALRTLLAELG